MIVVIDTIFALTLLFCGYAGVCCYLNGIKLRDKNFSVLKPDRDKIIYLVVGILSSVLFITLFQEIYHLSLLSQLRLISLLLCILPAAMVDLRIQKIPNQFIIAAFVLRVLLYIPEVITSSSNALLTLKYSCIGTLVIGGFFLVLLLLFKNSVGMGDVKLFAIMGLYQGLWGAVNSVFFSLLVTFVISVALLVSRKKGKRDTIPFGPGIYLGTLIGIALAGM